MTDASSAPTGLAEQKRARAEKAVSEIVEKLGAAAKLECKDAPDGSLSIAVSVEGEVPGLAPGKRSPVLEALQFLVNKLVNKPGEERRHVALGIGGHPEPRGPKPGARPAAAAAPGAPAAQVPVAPTAAPTGAPRAAAPAAGARGTPAPAARPAAPARPARGQENDERSLEVSEDAALAKAARQLAEKSAIHGRYYAIAPMKPEDRARVLKAVDGVPGVKVAAAGEGRNRRVVFTPDKPVALPKRTIPDYGEDEE